MSIAHVYPFFSKSACGVEFGSSGLGKGVDGGFERSVVIAVIE